MAPQNPLTTDLDAVVLAAPKLWAQLKGKRLFITGGTGFFGRWLLGSFVRANERFELGAVAHVLTRNPDAFRQKDPLLASRDSIVLHQGNMTDFEFPRGEFHHVLHVASESNAAPHRSNPVPMLDSNVLGTRRVLEFARCSGAVGFLYTSSGAVYGNRYAEPMDHVDERYTGAPDPCVSGSAYGIGKRMSEFLCRAYADQVPIQPKIARCFAFVGPYLPMTANYAIGNFIHDALQGKCIQVNGTGTPRRSYLYAADLALWLWTILLEGKPCYPYNVGSETTVTIAELAAEVANAIDPAVGVRVAQKEAPGAKAEYYVPSTQRARLELGLNQTVSLRESIERTALWYRTVLNR